MDSPLPSTSAPPHALASQVGGHAGVLTTEDGSLVIKPALPLELKFYQALLADPALAPLHPFTPRFLGTLKLEGQVDESAKDLTAGISVTPIEGGDKDESFSIVLENLSHGFLKPNIIDIKLGTVLYDETASPEKVERMLKAAKATTSLETGVRLTGFQVYDNNTSLPVNTPKSYGKSIKPSDLPDGIAKFFPVGTSAPIETPAATEAPTSESSPAAPTANSTSANSGLPRRTLLPLLRAIRSDIAEIREAYASLEIRMVGGSLLVVYEGDWARAEEGVEKLGMVIDEEGEGDDDDEDEEEEGDDNDEEEERPPYVVKLIDFAHTRLVSGAGPDEGVLKGMDTVLGLLEGRIKDLGGADNS